MALHSRYQLDDVPWWLRPFFWAYSWVLGTALYFVTGLLSLSIRKEFRNLEHSDRVKHSIHCFWHQNALLVFTTFRNYKNHAWLWHPHWYMGPPLIFARLLGVEKFAYGSTGHGGVEAAQQIEQYLKQGYSCILAPDGPAGPSKKIHSGIYHLAQKSGVPILPIKISCRSGLNLPSWDKKILPLPFSKVIIEFGEPIFVKNQSFEEVKEELDERL